MLSLLTWLGAVAENEAPFDPDHRNQLPAHGTAPSGPADRSTGTPGHMPKLRFDDSQACLAFLEQQLEGFGTSCTSQHCSDCIEQPAPWRSL